VVRRPAPAPREAELARVLPAAEHWMSILTEDSVPGEETWTHLWVSTVRFPAEDLSRLLRLAADYVTAGVIITTADMSWLYHPPPHERRADRALNCLVPRVHSMSVRTVRSQRFQAQVALLCRQQDSEPFSSCLASRAWKRGEPWRTGGTPGQQCSLWLSGAMPEHGGDGITDRRRALEPGWLLAVHRKSCSSWRSGS
jgi:hypothetical protein